MVARALLVVALLLLLVVPSPAQEGPRIGARLEPEAVLPGEAATLRVMVQGQGEIRIAPMPEVDGLAIRPAGESSTESTVGGTRYATTLASWTVVPLREGSFRIPALEIQVDGRTWLAGPFSLEARGGGAEAWDLPPDVWGEPLLVAARVDRTEAFVGEPILWTFRLYNSIDLRRNPEFIPPSTPGFVAVEVADRELPPTAVGGTAYGLVERRLLLFPHAAGKATVGAASVRLADLASIAPMDRYEHPAFVERLFSGPRPGVLATEALPVRILPLPAEGRPAGFSGAVGRFRVQASLDRAEVPAGQPVTLEVRVEGRGNLDLMDPPPLPPLPDFKAYRTTSAGGLDQGSAEAAGTRTFSTVLVPRSPGERRIRGLRFSWFDPAEKVYRTQEIPPLALRVTPGTEVPAEPPPSPAGPSPDGLPDPAEVPSARGPLEVLGSPWLLAAQAGPLAALLAFLGLRGRPPRRRSSDAGRVARRRLAAGKDPGALRQALQDYLADRLGPALRSASRREAEGALADRGVGEEGRSLMRVVLDELDLLSYAPVALEPGGLEGLRRRALEALDRLEGDLR